MTELKSTNLSRNQIYELAEKFAEKTSYTPGVTDIVDYVENQLHGKIEYSDNPKDSVGGSISVNSRENFTIYLHSRLGEIKINANRSDDIDEAEKEANSFAAAFLMPEKMLRKLYAEKDGNLSALADAFKVSLTAMNWRCINLGLKKV